MDVLSDVLRSGMGSVSLLARTDYQGRWGVILDGQETAGLHYVERGECWLRMEGQAPLRLRQGDVALLPRGDRHILAGGPRTRAQPLEDFQAAPVDPSLAVDARVVCAAQRYEGGLRSQHPLLVELPALIHLPCHTIASCPSLSPCIQLLLHELEVDAPGRSALVELLLETLLLYVVRHWIQTEAHASSGWVRALRDRQIARALEVMHGNPATPWTVEQLAAEAGMSRPVFARRFRNLTGRGPASYLVDLRLRRGSSLLRTTERPLAEIADEVGFASAFSFSRAFKRMVGVSPSHYRGDRPDLPSIQNG
ncbi:MAG: cupin domain-containing protein [Nannocystales bacterium]